MGNAVDVVNDVFSDITEDGNTWAPSQRLSLPRQEDLQDVLPQLELASPKLLIAPVVPPPQERLPAGARSQPGRREHVPQPREDQEEEKEAEDVAEEEAHRG
eukprot:CAMPEP_0180509230 /NCGR_PEP_ID=MMETSP1036_2-20121128/49608_1 /TAXON_ID=632150 /ORGANISM="Azadinium spinosum, Strain 3D9" /LENGTH=101 /DNA_ID=CAMNT_0022519617 /DNA_START=55 /DNA_END=357 /DNA_ORIENTATION=+